MTTPRPSVAELLVRLSSGASGSTVSGATPSADSASGQGVAAAIVEHSRLLGQLSLAMGQSAKSAGATALTTGRWLGDLLLDTAPHLPVRDLETLREHHRGLEGEALADALVRNATRATSAVGIAGGALSAAKWTAPLTLVTFPVQIAVETLLVAAIEVKLVAELHEVYRVPVQGNGTQRGTAYVLAWANRRGINPAHPATVLGVVGASTRNRVGRRVAGRAGRNLGTLAPLFAGAALGAMTNHRETQKLADALRGDLRRRQALVGGLTGRFVTGLLKAKKPPRQPPLD